METFTPPKQNAGDHLANERTFLAWIRTSIGIIGLGFVVVKFSLFIKQVSVVLGAKTEVVQTGGSYALGILLVALGGLTIIFSFLRYNNTKRQLDEGSYLHSTVFVKIVTALILVVCIALLIYMFGTR